MLNVVQLCLAANNILFALKGNHAQRYSLNKKNKELKKPEVIIVKTKYASMLPLYRKQRFFKRRVLKG